MDKFHSNIKWSGTSPSLSVIQDLAVII